MKKVILTIVIAATVLAAGITSLSSRTAQPQSPTEYQQHSQYINANKILMFVTNHGSFARDLTTVFGQEWDAGTFFPYNTTDEIISGRLDDCVLYAAGLWLGGQVNGEIRVTVASYSDEYVPGPMMDSTFQPYDPSFRVYKLYHDSLLDNPNADYLNWPVDQGAPVDAQGRPLMYGHQMLWTVYNDADTSEHEFRPGNTDPLGLEIQQTVWGINQRGGREVTGSLDVAVEHTGDSPGWVEVQVVDPHAVNGHQYAVTFDHDVSQGSVWNVVDMTSGLSVLVDQADQRGKTAVEVDGFKVTVYGGAVGVKQDDVYSTDDTSLWGWDIPSGQRLFSWLGGADGLEWEGFSGALGWGGPSDSHGFGSYQPIPANMLPRVLLRLAEVNADGTFDTGQVDVSYGYRYLRNPGPPARPEFEPYIIDPTAGSYGFQWFYKNIPLSAWDVTSEPPRRLAMGFLENNVYEGLVDGNYWPPVAYYADNTSSSGPREWLWIFLDDYSETPNPDYQGNAIDDSIPVMYWATWARMAEEGWPGGDEFLIIPDSQYTNTPADTFRFTANPPDTFQVGSEALALYVDFKILNRGPNNIENLFLSLWVDPDVGDNDDDLVGCDTTDDIFFAYNSGPDAEYGKRCPAVGFKILGAWPMTAFSKWIGGTDPNDFNETYNYMQGLQADGSAYYFDGNQTTFICSGDPVTGSGDLDVNPADRYMFATTGPTTLASGDSTRLRFKLAVGQGNDPLESITVMKSILNRSSLLAAVGLTQPHDTLVDGENMQMSATGHYTDSDDEDITQIVEWSSSDTSVARVDSDGYVTACGPGTATIEAVADYFFHTIKGQTRVTVLPWIESYNHPGIVQYQQATSLKSQVSAPIPDRLTVFYREIGTSRYDSTDMNVVVGGDPHWEGSIPGSAVGLNTIEYYFRALKDTVIRTDPHLVNDTTLYRFRTSIPASASVIASDSTEYQMFGFPYALTTPYPSTIFGSVLGDPDDELWRLGRWNPVTQRYDEYPDISYVEKGQGFWLITRDTATLEIGGGLSTSPDEIVGLNRYATITLANGWNQIASPLAFNVAWSACEVVGGSRNQLWRYDSQANTYYTTNTLTPFQGYFTFNSSGNTNLRIPFDDAGQTAVKGAHADSETSWEGNIEIRSGRFADLVNTIGVAKAAGQGVDGFDFRQPPPFGTYVSLGLVGFDEKGNQIMLGGDYRAESDGEWEFEILLTGNTGEAVEFDASGLMSVPGKLELALLNPVTGWIADLRSTPQLVLPGEPSLKGTGYRLLVGKNALAEAALQAAGAGPENFRLCQNYPNPFNAGTVIRFNLPHSADVRLRVFNIMGQLVTTLVDDNLGAGEHSLVWSADAYASGVYFYRLDAGSFVETRKMVLMK